MKEDASNRITVVKGIIAEVLGVDPDDIEPGTRFKEDLNADSLHAIEIITRLEKAYSIKYIPQNELARMTTLDDVYSVLREYANWTD
jgi:acyl carrier protein